MAFERIREKLFGYTKVNTISEPNIEPEIPIFSPREKGDIVQVKLELPDGSYITIEGETYPGTNSINPRITSGRYTE